MSMDGFLAKYPFNERHISSIVDDISWIALQRLHARSQMELAQKYGELGDMFNYRRCLAKHELARYESQVIARCVRDAVNDIVEKERQEVRDYSEAGLLSFADGDDKGWECTTCFHMMDWHIFIGNDVQICPVSRKYWMGFYALMGGDTDMERRAVRNVAAQIARDK